MRSTQCWYTSDILDKYVIATLSCMSILLYVLYIELLVIIMNNMLPKGGVNEIIVWLYDHEYYVTYKEGVNEIGLAFIYYA